MDKKKILIVDDKEDTLMVIEKQLTTAGYDVVTANGGLKALELADSQKPDVIVLDIQMPDMDGGEVACKLEENPRTKDIPIVFSTCLLSESEIYQCNGKIMLAKSKDTKELVGVINDILQSAKVSL